MSGHPFFFGYGSLVNTATHAYPEAQPATVIGWRRVWVPTTRRKVAYLSVERAAGTEIDGLIAAVPGGDWVALDQREAAYDRVRLGPDEIRHGLPSDPEISLYQVAAETAPRTRDHPILLSYLDVVVQGFARVFGRSGVSRFFETTAGWDIPILDDRANPRYPRAQPLDPAERAIVDWELARLPAVVQELE